MLSYGLKFSWHEISAKMFIYNIMYAYNIMYTYNIMYAYNIMYVYNIQNYVLERSLVS